MQTAWGDYRSQLKSELRRRQGVNPRYSLRSFARTLGLSPAFVSKILRGQKNLSPDTAVSIAERLGYTEAEAMQFAQMVQAHQLRSARLQSVVTPLSELVAREDFNPLSLESFQVISDWYHLAILELSECRNFKSEPQWIAERLGISVEEARLAVERLLRLGQLEKVRGRLVKANRFIATPTDRPSQAIRNHHQQMLEKAKRAIEERDVELRDVTSITLAIDPAKLEVAKAEIKRFRRRMARLLETSSATEVYQLNVQFFPLSGGEPAKEKS